MVKSSVLDATAVLAGVLFSAGWWLWIDANIYVEAHLKKLDEKDPTPTILFYYYLPGIFATLGLIMTNLLNLENLNPYSWLFDEAVETKAKIWLFVSFTICFGGIIAAIWIMIQVFLPPNNSGSQWPGIALTLQNFLILLSSFILFWSRSERVKGEYEEI